MTRSKRAIPLSPLARKAQSESLLRDEGIPFLPSLPCIESEAETELRTSLEVGVRIACLRGVSGYAFENGDSIYKDYLEQNNLWEHLSPKEVRFISAQELDQQARIDFTWGVEAIFLLMWAVKLFDILPIPRRETDLKLILEKFPIQDSSPWSFIRSVRLREKAEIMNASDLVYRLHWATIEEMLGRVPRPTGLNAGVVKEWHRAINWITRYGNEDWDDVSTDT